MPEPTPEPTPTPTPTPAPAPTPPPAEPPAWVAELAKMQAKLDAALGELGQRKAGDETKREKEMRDKGDYERLITERDEKLKALSDKLDAREKAIQATARDRAISDALDASGVQLAKGAKAHLIRLWRDEFDTADDGSGGHRVATKDFKTADQVVKERLGTPGGEWDSFVAATSRGGAGGAGNSPAPSGSGPGDAAAPADMLTRLIAARQAGGNTGGFANGQAATIGFRRA